MTKRLCEHLCNTILGVTARLGRFFRTHPGMSWASMHLWHGDHDLAIAKFKVLASLKELLESFKFRNLQPM